ncbi:SIS domain-containing protein [Sphingorhabdus sp. EL138]|uniref:KpsF/GutQ family sugar-phosphate isomerase n=1 Tax=Sphingorhabdus sp. EL138 TaxID=2073156 RepID=UPI0025FEBCEE|nr:KpsF/GutQ family sugar-phosphate isomerase [Sphingorhabdus sp. EL138]
MIPNTVINFEETAGRVLARGVAVIELEAQALGELARSLDISFAEACEAIVQAKGRVVITGMGKSGHIGRKFAATLSATGTPSNFVHPAEAAHGDLGMLVPGDVLVAISNSGNTPELRAFLNYAESLGVLVIGIASRPRSLVLNRASIGICLPNVQEACNSNIAPTTSTTVQLALCDALAMAVMDLRGFGRNDMSKLHPGGAIGLRLSPISQIMHGGANLPIVTAETSMRDTISIMTGKGFGIAGVVDGDGRLIGVISDGDLRRNFDNLKSAVARDVMSVAPKMIADNVLAEEALGFLNEHGITCAFVVSEDDPHGSQQLVGIIHVHDFLRLGFG